MGPKKLRKNVRKIQVLTDTPTEFELGYTAADIERRRVDREQREREEAEKHQREEREREETRRLEDTQLVFSLLNIPIFLGLGGKRF